MRLRTLDLRGPVLAPEDVRARSGGPHLACGYCGRFLLEGERFDRVLFDLAWQRLLGVPARGPGSLAWWAAGHLSALRTRCCPACTAGGLTEIDGGAGSLLWARAARSAAALYASENYTRAAEEALRHASLTPPAAPTPG